MLHLYDICIYYTHPRTTQTLVLQLSNHKKINAYSFYMHTHMGMHTYSGAGIGEVILIPYCSFGHEAVWGLILRPICS